MMEILALPQNIKNDASVNTLELLKKGHQTARSRCKRAVDTYL